MAACCGVRQQNHSVQFRMHGSRHLGNGLLVAQVDPISDPAQQEVCALSFRKVSRQSLQRRQPLRLGQSSKVAESIFKRSAIGNMPCLELCRPTATTILSNRGMALRTTSSCPFVTGSNEPGKIAARIQSKLNKLKWTCPYFLESTCPAWFDASTRSPCSKMNQPPEASTPLSRTTSGRLVNRGMS